MLNRDFPESAVELLELAEKILLTETSNKDFKAFETLWFQFKNMAPSNLTGHELRIATESAILVHDYFNLGQSAVLACLYFNLINQKAVSLIELKNTYNAQPGNLIKDLNNIPELVNTKINLPSDSIIKLMLSNITDIRVILIKLILQLVTLRHLEITDAKVDKTPAREAEMLYVPMAHRLGLYAIKTELEELAMKHLHTEIYREIAKKLNDTKQSREEYIKRFNEPISQKLKAHKFKFIIKGRPKSIHSIWTKMKKQAVPFEEVYDLFAIRIILDTPLEKEKEDCWKVYSLVTENYEPNPYRLRDWISSPKNSGYESLHATVIGSEGHWIEIQIRTDRMDEIAEKGNAAHWKYKGGSGGDWLGQIREVLENPSQDAFDQHNPEKSALYTDEIFIFTPEGDLRKFKTASTVLDFAYNIHSDVGNKCTGAIINGKIAPIDREMKNGDRVKILTSKTQKPTYEWLDMVVGQRAKTKIRRALKAELYKKSEIGKELVRFKLNQIKKELNDATVIVLLDYFEYESPLEFFEALGSGKLDAGKIKKAFETPAKQEVVEAPVVFDDSDADLIMQNPVRGRSGDLLIIDKNISAIEYTLSRCCNPIHGDQIFGFVTINTGTKIHKLECPNARDLIQRYPYRVIRAVWNETEQPLSFIANIRILGRDSVGIVNEITRIINDDLKVRMRGINFQSKKNNEFVGNISLFVEGKGQLNQVMARLNKVKDVIQVTRTDVV
ncbi:MAG TPA: RelA/SpoT family protein [Bacteroidales bacterium]|nr:RelA/SpoT family protein [Bacteroidales bacterium]